MVRLTSWTPTGAACKAFLKQGATFVDMKTMYLHLDSNLGIWKTVRIAVFQSPDVLGRTISPCPCGIREVLCLTPGGSSPSDQSVTCSSGCQALMAPGAEARYLQARLYPLKLLVAPTFYLIILFHLKFQHRINDIVSKYEPTLDLTSEHFQVISLTCLEISGDFEIQKRDIGINCPSPKTRAHKRSKFCSSEI